MTNTARHRRVKNLDAGPFHPVINSFALHLRAEGKAPKTVRTYTEAAAWFATEHLRQRHPLVELRERKSTVRIT